MVNKDSDEYHITDYNYVLSSIGNAYFSGISFDRVWSCIDLSSTREELYAAISAAIRVKELTRCSLD